LIDKIIVTTTKKNLT